MLWIYDHYKYSSAGIEFRRQNLTSRQILTSKVDPLTGRVKTVDGPRRKFVNSWLDHSLFFLSVDYVIDIFQPLNLPLTLQADL